MPEQNGGQFTDNAFKCISEMNGNGLISSKISLRFVPSGPNDNKSVVALIMTWCWKKKIGQFDNESEGI